MALLRLVGPQNFLKMIKSKDWTFIPEQWQVQMWTKVFQRIPMDHMILYSPQLDAIWWPALPGVDGSRFLDGGKKDAPEAYRTVVANALEHIAKREGKDLSSLDITWIATARTSFPWHGLIRAAVVNAQPIEHGGLQLFTAFCRWRFQVGFRLSTSYQHRADVAGLLPRVFTNEEHELLVPVQGEPQAETVVPPRFLVFLFEHLTRLERIE